MAGSNSDWKKSHLEIVAKMVRVPVVGSHHKQRDTIKQWCNFDGDVIEQAMDDLVAKGILQETARGTVKLVSVSKAKRFLEENDDDDSYCWFY